jgi:tetratricopeptide (TPR) repeat protein
LLSLLVIVAASIEAGHNFDDPEADHTEHAMALDESGDMDGAINAFRAAAKFAPKEAYAWNNLGIALADVDSDLHEKEIATCTDRAVIIESRSLSEAQLDKIAHLLPGVGIEDYDFTEKYSAIHTSVGIQLMQNREVPHGIEAFRAAVKYSPQLAVNYDNLGMAFRSHAHWEEAIDCYAKALSIEPTNTEYINKLEDAKEVDKSVQRYVLGTLDRDRVYGLGELQTMMAAARKAQGNGNAEDLEFLAVGTKAGVEPSRLEGGKQNGWLDAELPVGFRAVPAGNNIPRIIHQTWKTRKLPKKFKALQETWLKQHKLSKSKGKGGMEGEGGERGWGYKLWTDKDNRKLIKTHYAWFLDTYDSYRENIQRVDAARVFILYHHGGVYADLDTQSLRPMDALVDGYSLPRDSAPGTPGANYTNHTLVLGFEPEMHYFTGGVHPLVCNAVMASTRGHPFWVDMMRKFLWQKQLERTGGKSIHTLSMTGPHALTEVVFRSSGYRRSVVLGSEYFYPTEARDNPYILALPLKDFLKKQRELQQRLEKNKFPNTSFTVHYHAGTWLK